MSGNPQTRSDYRHFEAIATRWLDNDVYGHVNNVVYYAFFDTVVNKMLIDAGLLDIHQGQTIAFVIETQCRYARPIAFPDMVHAGVRVSRLGVTSVRYEIGLFRNDEDDAAAEGHFIHVYVDRETRRPVAIPAEARVFLATLAVS